MHMQNKIPEVSIIIPVYNTENYLDKCIQSIVGQTFDNFEIILVDDGSTDRSGEICDVWARKDNRIKVLHQTNGGSAKARNAGLQQARGSYIGFADGDDRLEPNMLQVMIDCAHTHESDVVIVGHYDDYQGMNGKIVKQNVRNPKEFSCNSNSEFHDYFPKLLKAACFFQVWDKLYRRELIEQHHVRFDQSMPVGQDASFNIPLAALVNRVDVLAVPLYHYSCREGSMSSINFKESYLQSRVRAFEWAESTLRDWYPQMIVCFANTCVDQMGKLAEGLYSNASFSRTYRNQQIIRIIANQTVRKCAQNYTPSDLRNRIVAFAIRHNSVLLLKCYAKGIVMLKNVRNKILRS